MRNKLAFLLLLAMPFLSTAQKVDWLEDQAPAPKITRTQTNKLSNITAYPRISTGSLKKGITAEQMACFDICCWKPFSLATVAAAQAINPNLAYLRIYCPQEWQGGADADNKQGSGYPFNSSSEVSANNKLFAGHFAYKPYTTLSAGISTDADIAVSVSDVSKIAKGSAYYVIRPADSWKDAEHVQIIKTDSVLLIKKRGYKGNPKVWPAGSIIAQHQIGNGFDELNWCFNLSSKCPEDSNGRKINEVLAEWLVKNYDKDDNGKQSVAQVDGILYDSDAYAFIDGGNLRTRNADFDNDGKADWGYTADGKNIWYEGLEKFYQDVRKGLDDLGRSNVMIVGGVAESWGLIPNNGTQMEAAWAHIFAANGALATEYNHIGFYMSSMKAQSGHGVIAPRVTDVHDKEASALYYGKVVETRNEPVRFSFAMSMMFDGTWYSNQNGFGDAFHYFDEEAVYTSGDNYGKSVLKTNTADILKNSKWLGEALGAYKRIYVMDEFSVAKNKIPNGNFESALSGWTGNKASAIATKAIKYEGAASLKIIPEVPNASSELKAASVSGPSVSLTAEKEYTLCFAVYSEASERKIQVKIGSYSQMLFVPKGWTKNVLTWKEKLTTNAPIIFEVGAELTPVNIDQLYIFEGSADLFRRDFKNGIILANAGNSAKTIPLEKGFQRIVGNLDPLANSGEKNLNNITLQPHEGVFLIRQK